MSPNSKFADIEAVRRAQIEAGELEDSIDGSSESEDPNHCFSVSVNPGIEDIALHHSWINDGCEKYHEANATLGPVVCVSPHGYTYVPGTAITTPDIPGGGAANYSSIAANIPFRTTAAPKTTVECGLCLSLFAKVNPSIDAKASGACSASIMPGYTYCMSPSSTPTRCPAAKATQESPADDRLTLTTLHMLYWAQ
ncbi:hypothetical protein K456DRAFT_1725728 [Colletotrichum gloeosporioides 23]|nr:hypothetical protein K456DRAFT_1725728 [Colletotrichum gloeosporioides 23]